VIFFSLFSLILPVSFAANNRTQEHRASISDGVNWSTSIPSLPTLSPFSTFSATVLSVSNGGHQQSALTSQQSSTFSRILHLLPMIRGSKSSWPSFVQAAQSALPNSPSTSPPSYNTFRHWGKTAPCTFATSLTRSVGSLASLDSCALMTSAAQTPRFLRL